MNRYKVIYHLKGGHIAQGVVNANSLEDALKLDANTGLYDFQSEDGKEIYRFRLEDIVLTTGKEIERNEEIEDKIFTGYDHNGRPQYW